jgi:two-component system chemotaxis response regulator CheB
MAVPVIALVSSRGGLEALVEVLRSVAADTPAAFVVLQHQPPQSHSELVAIAARQSAIPVVPAVDGDRLEPAKAYVVPPGQHALVDREGRLLLIQSGDFPPYRPSADLLLVSMALSLGSGAIAVVLSGTGHDGATGALAVHRLGGTVLATDAATSASFEMPLAAIQRDAAVDQVLPLRDVGPYLVDLVRGRNPETGAPPVPAP